MYQTVFIYDNYITHYEFTKSRSDIVSMRDSYSEWIEKYRSEGYQIFYQDETWIFMNMDSRKVWKDSVGNFTSQLPKTTSGSDNRSILSHVCSESLGLLDG